MATRTVLGLLLLLSAPGLLAPGEVQAARKRGGKGAKGTHQPVAKTQQQPVPPQLLPDRKPPEEAPPERKARPEEERELKRGERVEFDGRLIEGQTAAAGAIYLFERLPSELRSMVTERKSYRREILETLYPNGAAPAGGNAPDRKADR